jgi:hypothetical protein
MAKDIAAAVREVCQAFPEVEEYSSHGSPNFRVCKKTFATYVVNHHGDGRVALWLNVPRSMYLSVRKICMCKRSRSISSCHPMSGRAAGWV